MNGTSETKRDDLNFISTSIKGFLLPKLQDIFFIAIFLGVIGIGPGLLNVDGDLGRHITIGEYILDHWTIPTRDLFSHTLAGQPLTPHEWLAQVIYAVVYRLGGLDGMVWLCALLLATTFLLVFRQSYHRSGLILLGLGWAILAAAASSLHWLARPHLFTLLIVPLWVAGLERIRRGDSVRWWLLPILMLIWANLHGAFIVGFMIWGMVLVGEIWDRWTNRSGENPKDLHQQSRVIQGLLATGGVSLLATLLNPSGWRLWETSLGYIRNRYLVSHTAEYLPPNFHEASTWPFLVMIFLSVWVLGRSRGKMSAASVLLLGGWAVMGLYSVRNVPIYALVAAPLLAEISGKKLQVSSFLGWFQRLNVRLGLIENHLRGVVWPALVTILVALALTNGVRLDFSGQGNRFDPEIFPVEAVNWLEDHPIEGEMFNYFPWGGYLLYRLWPAQEVFIDGQTDFYGEALTRQYEQVITLGEGWWEVLQEYGVSWVIMPTASDLAQALIDEPGWQSVYQDGTAVIIVHDKSG